MFSKIAITGGLSCGKSTVCRFLSDLGAHVVNADEIVHQILRSPNSVIGKKVIALLGSDIIVDNNIDRRAVAKKVFNNPGLLSKLENILHPAVFEEINTQYRRLSEQEYKIQKIKTDPIASLFIAEIPLLFEVGGEKYFDHTVAVVAPEDQCKQRFTAATGLSEKDYEMRMARQLPQQEKGERADFVIENNGSLEHLHRSVVNFYKNFLNPN